MASLPRRILPQLAPTPTTLGPLPKASDGKLQWVRVPLDRLNKRCSEAYAARQEVIEALREADREFQAAMEDAHDTPEGKTLVISHRYGLSIAWGDPRSSKAQQTYDQFIKG